MHVYRAAETPNASLSSSCNSLQDVNDHCISWSARNISSSPAEGILVKHEKSAHRQDLASNRQTASRWVCFSSASPTKRRTGSPKGALAKCRHSFRKCCSHPAPDYRSKAKPKTERTHRRSIVRYSRNDSVWSSTGVASLGIHDQASKCPRSLSWE